MCAERKLETDVLIVGSGAVGVAAGIEAREAGASVILLEKEEILGGAAAVSGGGCAIVDTFLQREAGIEDSHDLAFEDHTLKFNSIIPLLDNGITEILEYDPRSK